MDKSNVFTEIHLLQQTNKYIPKGEGNPGPGSKFILSVTSLQEWVYQFCQTDIFYQFGSKCVQTDNKFITASYWNYVLFS